MRAGELRHIIQIQTGIGTADGMGGETIQWKDYIDCDQWESETVYALGDVVKPTTDNGFYYVCSRAGTSGATEPTFPVVLTSTVDDPNGAGAEWTCTGDGSIRAAMWPLRSKEVVENMRVELPTSHKIRIRYMNGLSTSMRLIFNGYVYNIVGEINPDERNIYLDLLSEKTMVTFDPILDEGGGVILDEGGDFIE